MRFHSAFLLVVIFASALVACAAETAPATEAQVAAPDDLATDQDRILYVLGHILGQNIANAELSDEELSRVLLGLTDSAMRRESQVDIAQYGPMLQAFMDERIGAAAEGELAEATSFVEEQAAVEGATRTDSGIVIHEITPGTGETPEATDTVQVHYHGTLRDGSVFDSSVERNEPATFALNQVIPCWTEGVQHIREGGKSRLICPPELAYGPEGRPGIPANAALIFEVELLSIQ